MKPRWAYEIVGCRKRTKRSGVCAFFNVVRNDGKEVASVRDEDQATKIMLKFESWAVKPWR